MNSSRCFADYCDEYLETQDVRSLKPRHLKLVDHAPIFHETKTGNQILEYDSHTFHKNNTSGLNTYWRCSHAKSLKCRMRMVTTESEAYIANNKEHNHKVMRRLNYGDGFKSSRRLKRNIVNVAQ